jgi:Na+/proline symporter
MISNISTELTIFYLVVVHLIQTAVDVYFTRPLIPGNRIRRAKILFFSGGVALLVTSLVISLSTSLHAQFLLSARANGNLALAMLAVVVEYFLWALPYIAIKGFLVHEWVIKDEIKEKRQMWVNYLMVSAIVTLFLSAALFIATVIVPPLMTGLEVLDQ